MAEHQNIEVRQAIESDLSALEVFYKKAYGELRGTLKCKDRWDWLNRKNPYRLDTGMPIWIAVCGGKVVGHSGAMKVACKIGGETCQAAWDVDTFVLPEYRGQGIGRRLQKANQDAHDVFMCLYMSEANRAIKKKIGGMDGPLVTLYVHIRSLNPIPIFDTFRGWACKRNVLVRASVALVGRLGGFNVLAVCLSHMMRRRQKPSAREQWKDLDIRAVEGRFGKEATKLWNDIRNDFDLAVERDNTYLNWKYTDQPNLHYQKYYAFNKGNLVGIVVFRLSEYPQVPFGVIADIICRREDVSLVSSLAAFARAQLYKQGAEGVYCATGLRDHGQMLQQLGFVALSQTQMIWHNRRGRASTLGVPSAALLGKGDMDWDQYLLLSQPSLLQVWSLLHCGVGETQELGSLGRDCRLP